MIGIQVVPRIVFALKSYDFGAFSVLEVIALICPFCNAPMEKGLLHAGNLIVWVKKKHRLSLLPKEGEVVLDRNLFSIPSVPACICKQCKKVIADYSENTEGEN